MLRGTFTETFGIIVTLILFEIILAKNRKKERDETTQKACIRAIKMIQIPLNNYNLAALAITTPLKDASTKPSKLLERGFPFRNLSGLYENNDNMIDGFHSTKAGIVLRKDGSYDTIL